MITMLKKENIQIIEEVIDWRAAIEKSVSPLVERGYVEKRYIDEIIKNTVTYGPYYVLAPDIALIHANSDQGVIKKQLAVTVLRNAVCFSEESYDVRLLIVLAATDNYSHMDAIRMLAKVLKDTKKIDKICNAKNVNEVFSAFFENSIG